MSLITKQKQTYLLRKRTYGFGGGRDSEGLQDGYVHTAIFKMDNQQGPIV